MSCDPATLGVNRTITRTNAGEVMQYDEFWMIAKSELASVTAPHGWKQHFEAEVTGRRHARIQQIVTV